MHDVLTPFDSPDVGVREHLRIWHPRFEVRAAAAYLKGSHPETLPACYPGLREPFGTHPSFWMRKQSGRARAAERGVVRANQA